MATTALGAPVTVLVTRRVRAGHEAAFEAAMTDMMAAATGMPGHLGCHLVRPGDDSSHEAQLYHVVFAFDTPEHLAAWQGSAARAAGLAAVAPHTEGEQQVRQLTGLAHWFVEPRGPQLAPPPRWKVAVVTWLGIYPTVLLLFLTVAPLVAHWPLVLRVGLITVLVVLIMTWVVAPRLTRWLRGWLHPAPAARA